LSSPQFGRHERSKPETAAAAVVVHHLSPLKELATPVMLSRRLPTPSTAASAMSRNCEELVINGRVYRIIKKIGSGGSSEVFEVHDEDNVSKAIKQVSLTVCCFYCKFLLVP